MQQILTLIISKSDPNGDQYNDTKHIFAKVPFLEISQTMKLELVRIMFIINDKLQLRSLPRIRGGGGGTRGRVSQMDPRHLDQIVP